MQASEKKLIAPEPAALVREDILALQAYHVASAAGMVKLDAMENPYGLPADLCREIGEVSAETALNRYPDPTAPVLRAQLRLAFDIPAEYELLLGNGSDEIITMVTQTLARPGAVMLAPEPSFAMYRMNAIYSRMRYVGVPLADDFAIDAGRFLAAVREHQPALTFIAYPNNPTGNLFAERDVEAIIEASPGFVVLDEAYHAFAGKSFIDRLARYPNLMIMRTVSKLGLAGIRLGYAVARPEWIREFDKLRPPYNVNVLTQAVASRALERLDVLNAQAAQIRDDRTHLANALKTLPGLTVYPSDANFILARVPNADDLYGKLGARKVLIRNLHGGHALLENCVRFTVGTPEENEQLLAALRASL